jgi:hypothetical protein
MYVHITYDFAFFYLLWFGRKFVQNTTFCPAKTTSNHSSLRRNSNCLIEIRQIASRDIGRKLSLNHKVVRREILTPSQPAPTILVLKNWVSLRPWKKWDPKYWVPKIRSWLFFLNQKEKRQPGLFFFKSKIARRKPDPEKKRGWCNQIFS